MSVYKLVDIGAMIAVTLTRIVAFAAIFMALTDVPSSEDHTYQPSSTVNDYQSYDIHEGKNVPNYCPNCGYPIGKSNSDNSYLEYNRSK